MQSVGMSSTRQSLGNAAIGGTRSNFLVSMPARPMRMRGAVRCSALESESKRGSVVAKAATAQAANYSKRLLSTDQITTTYLSGRLRQASPLDSHSYLTRSFLYQKSVCDRYSEAICSLFESSDVDKAVHYCPRLPRASFAISGCNTQIMLSKFFCFQVSLARDILLFARVCCVRLHPSTVNRFARNLHMQALIAFCLKVSKGLS